MSMDDLNSTASMVNVANNLTGFISGVAKERVAAGRADGPLKSLLHATYSRALRTLPASVQRTILDAIDPVLELAIERLQDIYSNTFSAQPRAFEYCQACLALAKVGFKITHLTLLVNAGDDCVSTYTSHLERLVGIDNHCLFDPSLFYSSCQLRMEVPSMSECFVCTGYRMPPGTMQPINLEVLLMLCMGSGLPGWPMYGSPSRSFCITGWKRLEVSGPIAIRGITEDRLASLLRRVTVVQLSDPDTRCDPRSGAGVGAFVVSATAVAAGRKIQASFESRNDELGCMSIAIQYHHGGGDRGISAQFMRMCCGISPVSPAEQGPHRDTDISLSD